MDNLTDIQDTDAVADEYAESTEYPESEEAAQLEFEESAERADEPDSPSDVSDQQDGIDYEQIIAGDIAILKSEFPELKEISDITELNNPLRYAALRDMGLTAEEAYLATTKRTKQDTRSHLKAAYGKSAASPVGMMSQRDLSVAREIFADLSDAEIHRLYRKIAT